MNARAVADQPSVEQDPETAWPSASQVNLCKQQISHFPWAAPSDLTLYRIHGTILSRAASGYAWHYSQNKFDATRQYFDGLEWSPSGRVGYLELFVDWYAFAGSQLENPEASNATAVHFC